MSSSRGAIFRVIAVVVLFIGLFVLGRVTGFVDRLSPEGIRTWIRDAGFWGFALFIAVFTLGELIHVPGMIFVVGGALAFGKVNGCAISLVAAIVSVSMTFVLVRTIGGRALTAVERPFMKKMLARLDDRPIPTVFVLRSVLWLAPALNYALALSSIRFRDYFIGSALGLVAPIIGITIASDVVLGLI